MSRRITPSRRAFLGGAAATIALPWLDALSPRRAVAGGSAGPPKRMLFYFVPNGMHMPAWTPQDDGSGFTLSPIMQPLDPVRNQLLAVSGLANRSAEDNVAGDHARGTGSFLTCMPVTRSEGEDVRNGISVDQVAAPLLGDAALFPSLQLGIDGGDNTGACDSGYACSYLRNISWASETTPLAKVTSPRLVFDRMFAGYDPNATEASRARRRLLRTSILDHALEDANRLMGQVGARDQQKLDEYLTGVRALEQRIASADEALVCATPGRPPEVPLFRDHVTLMTDLMVLAFECDLTRSVSFMLGNGSSYRSFPFLGVSGAHHEISHHQNDPARQADLQTIDTWEVEQLAYLLTRLDSITESNGTSLLYNSLVCFSSEIGDGNGHWHHDLPVLLAGRLGGAIDAGQHLRLADERPLADLYLALLQAAGSSDTSFGADSTGPLMEVLT